MQKLLFRQIDALGRNYHVAMTRLREDEQTFTHTHDFPEVFLVTAGAGVHHCNGVKSPLAPGALAWIAPADVHHYRDAGEAADARLQFINVAFAPAWWRKFAALFSPGKDLLTALRGAGSVPRTIDLRGDETHARRLHQLVERGGADLPLLLETTAALASASLAGAAVTRRSVAEGESSEAMPPWLAALLADLAKPEWVAQPIAFWQKRSGRSPEHLARSCRRFCGEPLTELVLRARIERAKALLRRGEEKIVSVALETGFQNLGYFYRTFRRLENCTPKAWAGRHAARTAVPRG